MTTHNYETTKTKSKASPAHGSMPAKRMGAICVSQKKNKNALPPPPLDKKTQQKKKVSAAVASPTFADRFLVYDDQKHSYREPPSPLSPMNTHRNLAEAHLDIYSSSMASARQSSMVVTTDAPDECNINVPYEWKEKNNTCQDSGGGGGGEKHKTLMKYLMIPTIKIENAAIQQQQQPKSGKVSVPPGLSTSS